MQLIGLRQEVVSEKGRQLIARTREEVADAEKKRKFIELIETVFVYKFPDLSREEIVGNVGTKRTKTD